MKKFLFLGMVMVAIMSFNPMLNAQNKHGYISIDEVVQLMPEYKKPWLRCLSLTVLCKSIMAKL